MANCLDQQGYGEGKYGFGGYGGALDFRNLDVFRESLRSSTLYYRADTNLGKLVRVLVCEANELSYQIQQIAQSHNIDAATGATLDLYGMLVGVDREENESDDSYRTRIKGNGFIAVGDTTTNEMMQLTKLLLDTDYANISFNTDLASDPATFKVEASSSVVNDSPLTASEVESLLTDAVPAGHEATLTVV